MNAVIYARYSSHNQTEQSIEGQLRDNYAFAKREGYTVIAEYIDRAQSGTTDNRTNFKRMIADAAKRQFQIVIVWKLDRFARNRYDSAIYKAKLKKYGVRVVSCMENITDNPEGIILEGMLEAMAEYYSANLSENVKRGNRETIAKGNFCGGNIPFGYILENGKLIPDERTAPIVKYIFEQYASGVSKKEILDELSRRGVKSPYGRNITYASFRHALKNPTYIGEYTINGSVVEGCATPIISRDLFEAVQIRIASVARAPAANKAIVDYLLQGKAFCGNCGSRMVGESGRGSMNVVYHYYACAAKKKRHTCHKKNERKEMLEEYIVSSTVNYVLTPSNIRKIAKAVVEEYDKEFSSSVISDMEHNLSRMESDLNKCMDMLLDAPKSAHKKIYDRMESIELQRAELEKDLARQKIAYSIRYTQDEVIAWLKQFCDGDATDEAFRRRIIDVFVNSVFIYDDHIAIFYNIRTASAASSTYEGSSESSASLLSSVSQFSSAAPVSFDSLTSAAPQKSSDLKPLSTPRNIKSEIAFVFVNGVFGCVINRR